MGNYRVLSSDSHIYEPSDLWTSRIEPKFRDRCPRIVHLEEGDWWFCDGRKGMGASAGAQSGVRYEDPTKLSTGDLFENVRPGGYIPDEHVKDMDADGIDVDVLYPTAGIVLYQVPDTQLLTAIFRTYNDWLADFCKPYPDRLMGIALLCLDDVSADVKELERCAKLGLVGATIPVSPPDGRAYDSPEYEPLWAAAQDLGIPLSLHVGMNRAGTGPVLANLELGKPASLCNEDIWPRMSLADMIFSGVFERYPKLMVGSVEHELSWVPNFIYRLDYVYTQKAQRPHWHQFGEAMRPSDYFHRNVFLSFQEDGLGIKLRHVIGVDQLMWGSDYPHAEGTFPRSMEVLEEILVDCTEDEKAKIAGGNVKQLYHLA